MPAHHTRTPRGIRAKKTARLVSATVGWGAR